MIYHNLADIYSEQEIILNRLEARLHDLPPEQMNYHPDKGAWSITDIVEHVSIVDTQLLQLVTRLLQKAESIERDFSQTPSFPIDVESLVERSLKEIDQQIQSDQKPGNVGCAVPRLVILDRKHAESGKIAKI